MTRTANPGEESTPVAEKFPLQTATEPEKTPEPVVSSDKSIQFTPAPSLQAAVTTGSPTTATPETETIVTPFDITTQVYNDTFIEINSIIEKLNDIIAHRDYQAWLSYLTPAYIRRIGDSEYLEEISKLPALESRNIFLRNLKDYFLYVFVPSRTKAALDKISFIDNTHVKAYGTIFKQSGILYFFERIEGQWMVGIIP